MLSIVEPPDPLGAITLREAKQFLRISTTSLDDEIEPLIVAVFKWLAGPNGRLERSILRQTLELTFDGFCDGMLLRRPPFVSVTFVKYLDANSVERTLAADVYQVTAGTDGLPRLYLKPGQSWPATQRMPSVVSVRYIAGPDQLDYGIRQAMLMTVARLFENKGDGFGEGISAGMDPMIADLFQPYKVFV